MPAARCIFAKQQAGQQPARAGPCANIFLADRAARFSRAPLAVRRPLAQKKHDKNLPHTPCRQFYIAHLHNQPWVQVRSPPLLSCRRSGVLVVPLSCGRSS
jgi:hypothetical protein